MTVPEVLSYTTIGELIQKYRKEANLTLSEVANRARLNKGVISKIENGDTRRPGLKTTKAIARALQIPFEEMIEPYLKIEQRVEVLHEILLEAIERSNLSFISKIALQILQSPQQDSYSALQLLYTTADRISAVDVKILLYNTIVKYARERGIPQYIAKGLLQSYLIERRDFFRLEDTFQHGEEITHYVDFLSPEQRVVFYYRMALHAHNIKKYEKCISYSQAGFMEDRSTSELKARAYLAMINSFSRLGHYDAVEEHLKEFETYEYDFVMESTMITRAVTKARKKEFEAAIPLLQACRRELSRDNRIHVVNELFDIYWQLGEKDACAAIIKEEPEILPEAPETPYKHRSLGRYYRQKANYLMSTGQADQGMESYCLSLQEFGAVRAWEEIHACMNEILSHFIKNSKFINFRYVEALYNVYNRIGGKN